MLEVHDNPIYLDYASTTPIRPEILDDLSVLSRRFFANADSLHSAGTHVNELVVKSQKALAKMLNVLPHEVFFTSGASESNSQAVKGIALANRHRGNHVITTTAEHSSVLGAIAQLRDVFGFEVDYLNVDAQGQINRTELLQKLRSDTVLVAILAVNNETGSVNDVLDISRTVKKHSRAYVHVDGVQALAKQDIDLKQIDSAAFSAHKIYGIKGSGLLIKKAEVSCLPLINGGQQQYGVRGGTLDSVAAILWAKTLRLALEDKQRYHDHVVGLQRMLREYFSDQSGIAINSPANGSPYIFNASIENVPSEIMLNGLNARNIYVSAQSTCHSQSNQPSHVLQAMGLDRSRSLSSIRISLAHHVTLDQIQHVCATIMEIKNYVNHEL